MRRRTRIKLSARNQLAGTIVAITPGAVNGTIKVDVGGGNVVTSSITEEAIHDLTLVEGDRVTVVMKGTYIRV